jgi:hypothetical protein
MRRAVLIAALVALLAIATLAWLTTTVKEL